MSSLSENSSGQTSKNSLSLFLKACGGDTSLVSGDWETDRGTQSDEKGGAD